MFMLSCCPAVHLQVNSDKIYWQKNADGTFSQIFSEKKVVGHSISTKAVGSDERMDITYLYKYPEGEDEMKILSTPVKNHLTSLAIIAVIFIELEPLLSLRLRRRAHCCGNSMSLRLQSTSLCIAHSRGCLCRSDHGR